MAGTKPRGAYGIAPADLVERAGVQEGDRVADLGCGSHGALVFESAKRVGDSGRVYALDIQKNVLDAIASKRKVMPATGQIELVWSNLEKVGAAPVPEGSIDVALLVNVLNQSGRHEEILREALRLLRPGGTLLVVDWERYDASFAPKGCCPITSQELDGLAKQLGITQRDAFSSSDHHFGRVFIKPE